ncbi:MAG: porin family protein [Ginsengibacter sp.]
MKKIAFIIGCCLFVSFGFSQDSAMIISPAPAAKVNPLGAPKRAADHLMFQVSSDHWAGMPDSISSHQKGFSRGFNAYFMFDKQFKNAPKYSIAIGAGISTSNMVFKAMNIDLKSNTTLLPFTAVDSTNHFKKYKLATSYVEIPLEFRYMSKPSEPNKSIKAAIGFKAGTLVNAHTKGKTLLDKNNNTINSYIEKENNKRFISGTRYTATARLGYGIISVFGTYQLNNILKDAVGPNMKLFQVGLTISAL